MMRRHPCLLIFVCVLSPLASFAAEPTLEVIPIEGITREVHPIALRPGVMDARIHNIRIGQVVRLHAHPLAPELVAVLRGTARVRGLRASQIAGEPILREEIVEAGNLVFTPASAIHEVSNVGLEPLWCLVFLSPPFENNHYLKLEAPESALDLMVLPLDFDDDPRGTDLPDWAERLSLERSGAVNHFPGISGELIRTRDSIESSSSDPESWLVLLEGSGVLSHAGGKVAVAAPSLIRGLGEDWSVRGAVPGEDVVALRFRLPSNLPSH
jgi:quercetin dioxygenase-like cupin family protein